MQFAYVSSSRINNVDPSTNNITVELQASLVNGSQIQDVELFSAAFVPSIADYRIATTDAVVNKYLAVFGQALARASVILPQLQNGL